MFRNKSITASSTLAIFQYPILINSLITGFKYGYESIELVAHY